MPDGSTLDQPPSTEGRAAASTPWRVAAGLAGTIVILAAVVITIGVALFALVGMAVGARIDRSRGRRPSRQTSWLGACTGAALPIAALMVFALSQTAGRTDFVAAVRDSARARQERPPTVLERIAGRRTQPSKPDTGATWATSTPILWWMMATGGVMATGFFGVVIGTAAWAGGMLAAFGFTGRWPFPSTHDPTAIALRSE